MASVQESKLYFIFISIVFAVILSMWIVPVGQLFSDSSASADKILEALYSKENFRGIVMFGVLVCLWWWYGIFIARIDPAVGFATFSYDFISLGSYAIAFRLWPNSLVFSFTIFLASTLMLGRFWYTEKKIRKTDKAKKSMARKAIKQAIRVLRTIIAALFCALGTIIYLATFSDDEKLTDSLWSAVPGFFNFLVVCVLGLGIWVTFRAAQITEGFDVRDLDSWRTPRPVEEWLLPNARLDESSGGGDGPE